MPDVPGILTALRLTPELGIHLRGLADELLVNDFAGATIERADREMLATAVSAANDCFYCMDSHGAFASALLERSGETERLPLVDGIKLGTSDGFDDKMRALLHIARTVRGEPRDLTAADVEAAHAAGASDADVQLAVLIAAAFSMYNRMVEGLPRPDATERGGLPSLAPARSPSMATATSASRPFRDRTSRQSSGANRAVKWRSARGSSTIRRPRRSAPRSATQRTTSMT